MKNERWTEPVEVNLEANGKSVIVGPFRSTDIVDRRLAQNRGVELRKSEKRLPRRS